MKQPLNVYIGYDAREQEAYEVCRHSLLKFNNENFRVNPIPIKHQELREMGLFDRRWVIDEDGQYWDELDGKPFSTEFSHTRFALQEYATTIHNQTGWTMFVDCDFLFRRPVKELFDLVDDKYAVMCVKFDWKPRNTVKMDNKIQSAYPRKLWSSLMLWNLDHPENKRMGYIKLNNAYGIDLHTFTWLNDDKLIGSIPEKWNHVPTVSLKDEDAFAVHFSEGGPWFKGYEYVDYSFEWRKEQVEALYAKWDQVRFEENSRRITAGR
jgi:hypothetical protein